MYVKIYFPYAARFYYMDPLVAMMSKFDLKEKLAILLFVLEHTQSENNVFNQRKTKFQEDYLIAGDKGDSERLLLKILDGSTSKSDDEPHYAYLYDDR